VPRHRPARTLADHSLGLARPPDAPCPLRALVR
jgi:hypothetical protein